MLAIHPYMSVGKSYSIHTCEFVDAAWAAGGDQAVLDATVVPTAVIAALIANPSLVLDAKESWESRGMETTGSQHDHEDERR